MALRTIAQGAVLVLHWSTVQRLFSGPTHVHQDAIIVEIPDKASHLERLEYYEKARQIIKAKR